jgi:ankyrin repeat protein
LIVAARSGATDVVRVLLEHGADVNARTQDGRTALMGAAFSESGRPVTVKLLLDRGADPNAKSGQLTALTLAKNRGAVEIVRMLTAAGAQQ